MNTITSTDFVGWHRPNSRAPWNPVCHGASPDDVIFRLLDAVKGGDKWFCVPGLIPTIAHRPIAVADFEDSNDDNQHHQNS
jgi:hypothetical protein